MLVPLLRERSRFRGSVAAGMPWNSPTVLLDGNGEVASNERCAAALTYISRNEIRDHLTVTLWPLCDQGALTLPADVWRDEYSVIDLADGVEAALRRMDGAARRMAGQALRRGVRCELAGKPDAVSTYYALLEDSARRWGRAQPSIPRALLEAVVRGGGNDVEVWFARFEDRVIGGGVVLYGSAELFFWSAAMLGEFSRMRPSNALNVALLEAAAARGLRWYNMGSSFGLPGVLEFKDRLGARRVQYRSQSFESRWHRFYRFARRQWAHKQRSVS